MSVVDWSTYPACPETACRAEPGEACRDLRSSGRASFQLHQPMARRPHPLRIIARRDQQASR